MKIIHEREKCTGCGSCVVLCPKYWEMSEDGKSTLKNSQLNKETNNYELTSEEIGCNQEATDSCPVQIIHIKK